MFIRCNTKSIVSLVLTVVVSVLCGFNDKGVRMSHFYFDMLPKIWNLVVDCYSFKDANWCLIYMANQKVLTQFRFTPQWPSVLEFMLVDKRWIKADKVYFAIPRCPVIPSSEKVMQSKSWLRKQKVPVDIIFYNPKGYFSMAEAGLWNN